MSTEEGSILIQDNLPCGISEQSVAEALLRELGGLPLAIAHFVGYVTKSRYSFEQITASLHQHFRSNQIWSNTGTSFTSAYQHALNIVWDLALSRHSSDSRTLLNVVAIRILIQFRRVCSLEAEVERERGLSRNTENGSTGTHIGKHSPAFFRQCLLLNHPGSMKPSNPPEKTSH